MIDAAEAYRIGLVNEVVSPAELMTQAEAMLGKILKNGPLAVAYALHAVNNGMETSQAEGLELEAAYFGLCSGTDDRREGTAAFIAKRTPLFQGR
jgi:enoyl-CoA hydratase